MDMLIQAALGILFVLMWLVVLAIGACLVAFFSDLLAKKPPKGGGL